MTSQNIYRLPSLDDLPRLPRTERLIVEANIQAEIRKRKKLNIQAAINLPDFPTWVEANCWNADTVDVVGDYADFSRAKRIQLSSEQVRILRHVFTINPKTGRFPYRTIVFSKPKKSGKSAEGGFAASYFAANVEAPNNIYILANDREQSSGRVYKSALPNLIALGGKRESKYGKKMPNGTIVKALTSDAKSNAGDTYGLTIWDELWAYTSESSRLLFDELMPVSTRNNSIRLIVTYAGFTDSSDLLLQLYLQVFTDTKETDLQAEARAVIGLEDIVTTNGDGAEIPTCYEVPKVGLFYYNDHEQRMPWQQGEQGEALRQETTSFLTETNRYRLEQNRWQATENRYIRPDILASSFKIGVLSGRRMTFGVDAGIKKDCSALVGTYEMPGRYVTGYAKAWYPKPSESLDLEETIMAEIVQLFHAGLIHRREPEAHEKRLVLKENLICLDVWFDPTQMLQIARNLRTKNRLLIHEFEQNRERLKSDTFLLEQYNNYKIDNLENNDLKSHLESAQAEEQTGASSLGKIRIVKGSGKFAKPIDLAVAQSMSVWRTSKRPKTVGGFGIAQGKTKGWERRKR